LNIEESPWNVISKITWTMHYNTPNC